MFCKRQLCGHTWWPLVLDPKECPACKNYDWTAIQRRWLTQTIDVVGCGEVKVEKANLQPSTRQGQGHTARLLPFQRLPLIRIAKPASCLLRSLVNQFACHQSTFT